MSILLTTVLATTCTITIVQDGGPVVTGSNGEYSLTIPDVGWIRLSLEMLQLKPTLNYWLPIAAMVTQNFTTLTGASVSGKLIVNEASSGAAGVGMGIKRRDAADSAFFTPNNTDKFEWSTDEKTNGVPLTVALRETTAGAGRTGAFQAKPPLTSPTNNRNSHHEIKSHRYTDCYCCRGCKL